MKDRAKKALKRGASGILAVLLAVCLVGTPRAKAVVSEGALLGSIFGSLLVSMGYSWAADNMDVPTFGESIYKLTQEFDEAMKDTGNQLIRDLNLAGLTANGAGKLQFGYAWVQAARSFAEWFEEQYFFESNSSVILSSTGNVVVDGQPFVLSTVNYVGFKEDTRDYRYINAPSGIVDFGSSIKSLFPDTYKTVKYYQFGDYQIGFRQDSDTFFSIWNGENVVWSSSDYSYYHLTFVL